MKKTIKNLKPFLITMLFTVCLLWLCYFIFLNVMKSTITPPLIPEIHQPSSSNTTAAYFSADPEFAELFSQLDAKNSLSLSPDDLTKLPAYHELLRYLQKYLHASPLRSSDPWENLAIKTFWLFDSHQPLPNPLPDLQLSSNQWLLGKIESNPEQPIPWVAIIAFSKADGLKYFRFFSKPSSPLLDYFPVQTELKKHLHEKATAFHYNCWLYNQSAKLDPTLKPFIAYPDTIKDSLPQITMQGTIYTLTYYDQENAKNYLLYFNIDLQTIVGFNYL